MREGTPQRTEEIGMLSDKLARKNKELEILGEISSETCGLEHLDTLLNRILELLEFYFGFSYSMILLTHKSNALRVVASHGYPEKGLGAKVQFGKGIIGTAANRRKIIRIGNVRTHLMYVMAGEHIGNPEDEIVIKLPGLKSPQSQVAIPLLIRDELIGVLSVESDEINIFKQEDEQIIGLVANQAAIAIKNSQLFAAEKQRLEDMTEVNQKLSDLTQTQQHTLSLFTKYVPEPVVRKALRGAPGTMLEGEQRDVALLFCDIRDFTPVSEKLRPNEVVTLLNTYYAGMSEVIRLHGGLINQFVGDEIFVIFGALVPMADIQEKAVRCAVGMIAQLGKINEQLRSALGVSIQVGIGINYGPVISGNLGCDDKIAYAVTGDSVNSAKRIESLTKGKPNSILISDSVYVATEHLIDVAAREPVEVKGKQDKIKVYEVIGLRS